MKKILALALILVSMASAVKNVIIPPSTLTAAQQKLSVASKEYNTVQFQISGTWVATITFEATLDGTNFVSIPAVAPATGLSATTTAANGIFQVSASGMLAIRARVSAYTSGSVVVTAMAIEGGPFPVTSAALVAGATSVSKAEDVLSVDGDVGIPAMAIRASSPANQSGTNGDYEMLQMSAGRLWVDGSGVTQTMQGVAAHAAAISGNPVRMGGRARTSDITLVTNDQTVDAMMTVDGKQVMKPHAIRGATWSFVGAAGGITNTTAVTLKAAGAAGVRNCLTGLQISNGHATVSTEVVVKDGAAGTIIWRHWFQAAGGHAEPPFDVPLCGTAATLMEAVPITTGSAIYINAQGYTTQE